jgi:predicted MFS family arabinose efflux permease
MSDVTRDAPAVPRSALPWYLTSSSFWIAAMSLQGFLITWMLVGVLETPADEVGFGRALIDLPALAFILVGGLLADRSNGTVLLIRMHLVMVLPGLALAWLIGAGRLGFWVVIGFGLTVSVVQAMSDPARQAMLSRVTRTDIQRTVTITTIVGALAGLGGVWVGGRLDTIGLAPILILQALVFAAGALPLRRLPPLPAISSGGRSDVLAGIRSLASTPLIRNVIGLNLVSSLFNAGAYIIAIPFIVREIYHGDVAMFSTVMIAFTCGSISSNVILLYFMPLKHPGRLFLLMQVTRALILGLLITKPSLWLFYGAIFAWGFNMGITTTLVRTTVQELAAAEHRAQVLAVLIFSFMVAAPISSVLLGQLIAGADPLTALLPGIVISMLIFAWGVPFSGLWNYAAAAASPGRPPLPPSSLPRPE